MKARLVRFRDLTQLLLCTGKIVDCTFPEAWDFLLNYDDQNYYAGYGTWDYGDITMENYEGDTIAFVSDDGILHIENPELFRLLFTNQKIQFISSLEYADLHGRKEAIVRRLCRTGRIPGAVQTAGRWLIPKGAPYPEDNRTNKGDKV